MDLCNDFFKPGSMPDRVLDRLYFEKGYNLTVTEAAAILDVTERFLLRVFGDDFDYVLVPKGATQCFNHRFTECLDKLSEEDLPMNERIALKKDMGRYKYLTKKRVFINRESFFNFILKNMIMESSLVAIRLTKEEAQGVNLNDLNKIANKVISKFKISRIKSRPITHEELNKIVRNKVRSGKTIKADFLAQFYANAPLRKTVHDTQLHRYLNGYYTNDKYTIQGAGEERPVVRYDVLLDISDEDIYASFLIPNCSKSQQDKVKQAVVAEIIKFKTKEEAKQSKKEKK